MKITPLRHGGLLAEGRAFGPVKSPNRPRHRRKPSPLFFEGLRPTAAVELEPGETPGADWALLVHEPPWYNPRSTIVGVRVPLLVEISPEGSRYREALAPGERSHLAGGPRARLHNTLAGVGEAFASGVYHGTGGAYIVLDELYQYDDEPLDAAPFAERYGLLHQLIGDLRERNHDPLTMKIVAAALATGRDMVTALAAAPRPGELRYLVALNGRLDDPRSRLLVSPRTDEQQAA